jgi:VWFA-related protein
MHPFLAVTALLAMQLVETIEVRVVNVDVVVTDRDGKRVTGLTKDDFEIFEGKQPQAITHFHEVRPAVEQTLLSAPAPGREETGSGATGSGQTGVEQTGSEQTGVSALQRGRTFIFFVDNRVMHPVLRKHVTAELASFVGEVMRGEDRATVVTWDRTLKILAPLISDRSAIQAAIDEIAQTGTPASASSDFQRVQQRCTQVLNLAKSGRMQMKVAYEECIGDARIEAQRLVTYSRLMLNALDVTMSTLAGIEGRKVLVLAGTELPVKPGMDMFQWANALFRPYMTGFDAAMARPPDENDTQREQLEKIGRSANAHGVTLYLVSALMPPDTQSVQSPTGVVDGGGHFLRSANTEVAHETLARLTGGAAAPISRIRPLLENIRQDLASYYSLGYRPSADVKGERPIVVRTKNRAYTVRARQSYAPKTLDDQHADRVIANIFTPARDGEWQVQLRTGKPEQAERGRFSVPIEITAPATELTLIPRGGKLAGGFTVYVAVGNAQGALSTTFRQPNAIEIMPAEEASFRREPLVFTATLTIREGENLISAGVVDQVSNAMGFARATVNATASR